MNTKIFLIYLLLMAGVTYLIRTVPLIVFREKIRRLEETSWTPGGSSGRSVCPMQYSGQ